MFEAYDEYCNQKGTPAQNNTGEMDSYDSNNFTWTRTLNLK